MHPIAYPAHLPGLCKRRILWRVPFDKGDLACPRYRKEKREKAIEDYIFPALPLEYTKIIPPRQARREM